MRLTHRVNQLGNAWNFAIETEKGWAQLKPLHLVSLQLQRKGVPLKLIAEKGGTQFLFTCSLTRRH